MSFLKLCSRTSFAISKLATGSFLNKPCILKPSIRFYDVRTQNLKVTVCGAAGHVGRLLCLMLKQSPLIDEIAVYDTRDTCSFAKELSYIDTKPKVTAYSGLENIKGALRCSKVVIILAASPRTPLSSYSAMFKPNACVVQEIIDEFAKHCPKALLAIATNPVNSIVPLASEVLKSHGVFNPKMVFGVTSVNVVRANAFVAETQGLEPECVLVPVIGGHADQTIIPVLSQAKPCSDFTNEELEKITASVQSAHDEITKAKFDQGATLSCAFATSRFVISLIKGLLRQGDIVECAYVKSDLNSEAPFLATPVLLGPGGIQKNMGIPPLSEYERCQLENAIPLIAHDIKKGEKYALGVEIDADTKK